MEGLDTTRLQIPTRHPTFYMDSGTHVLQVHMTFLMVVILPLKQIIVRLK